jgi:hypothetical protein
MWSKWLGRHAQRDVDRLVADKALIPDLDPERVEENQRIACLERPVLPFADRLQDRVGDGRDEIGANVDPIKLDEMAWDPAELNCGGTERRLSGCRPILKLVAFSTKL